MLKAEIQVRYPSTAAARSIMNSLSPDDDTPQDALHVSYRTRGRVMRIRIGPVARVETMQATLDDLFRCIHAAEESLRNLTLS